MNTRPLTSRNKREGRYAGWLFQKHARALPGTTWWCTSISNHNRVEENRIWMEKLLETFD